MRDNEKDKQKTTIYFKIAGIASLIFLVKSLLFDSLGFVLFFPTSFMFFYTSPVAIIINSTIFTFSLFFILKGFLIMSKKAKINNLKNFIRAFIMLILITYFLFIIFILTTYLLKTSVFNGILKYFVVTNVLEPGSMGYIDYIFVVLFAIFGIWIFKLKNLFGGLTTWIGITYIYPSLFIFLRIIAGFIVSPGYKGPLSISDLFLGLLVLILTISRISLPVLQSILFFKLAKKE